MVVDCKVHEDMDVDLDRRFLQDLRELKMISEKEVLDEHKGYDFIGFTNVKSSPQYFAVLETSTIFHTRIWTYLQQAMITKTHL